MYGKLIDNNLQYFKNPLIHGEYQTFNPSEEILLENGWKQVVDSPMPSNIRYKYIGKWEEGEITITRVWDAVELTEEEKEERYKALAVEYIRERYSPDDENKIVREYLADDTAHADAFFAYNAVVEECKGQARREVYGTEASE